MKHFKNLKVWSSKQQTLYFTFVVILMIPSIFLLYTESMPAFVKISAFFLPLSIYLVLLIYRGKPGIFLWLLFPFLVLGAFQLVLLYLFGNSIIASDMFLNLITTNSGEVFELLDKLMPAIIGVILLYIPVLVLGIISIRSEKKLTTRFKDRARFTAICSLAIGSFFGSMAKQTDKNIHIDSYIYPVNVLNNIRFATKTWYKTIGYKNSSEGFSFHSKSRHTDSDREIYILIIGETSRAINWGLYGYNRDTTPLLEKDSLLVHYKDVTTQANVTHKSVPMILSSASAENYDVLYHQKSVITAFKEVGFKTIFLSNQLPNHSFTDFFASEADIYRNLKIERQTSDTHVQDNELLPFIDTLLLRKDPKLLIVIHTYGSHFDYSDRYNQKQAYFTPDHITDINIKNKVPLVNAYDNTIRYTDQFLHNIIQKLSQRKEISAMIYISDHGEDILDDSRSRFLHSSPLPSYYQLHIPLLIWTSDVYNRKYPNIHSYAVNNSHRPITTQAVFHTLLDIAGIDTPYKIDSLSVVNNKFKLTPRKYLSGQDQGIKLTDLKIAKEDIDMFKKLGLAYQ